MPRWRSTSIADSIPPGAADLGNMFQFTHDFEDYFCGIRDLAVSRRLNPALQTFAAWLSANKDEIQIQ